MFSMCMQYKIKVVECVLGDVLSSTFRLEGKIDYFWKTLALSDPYFQKLHGLHFRLIHHELNSTLSVDHVALYKNHASKDIVVRTQRELSCS